MNVLQFFLSDILASLDDMKFLTRHTSQGHTYLGFEIVGAKGPSIKDVGVFWPFLVPPPMLEF